MIEVKNVTKLYGNYKAVDNISFSIGKGEVIGLLGPNGAGKTTTMRILTCFLPATVGTVSVAGFDVFEDSLEVRRRVGYLPETPPLYPEMTVASYMSFISDIREVPLSRKKQRISEVIERTALGDHFDRTIGTLSKGYRQRVGLAQALLHDPEVLILDEPTVGLDPNQIIEIRSLIQNLAKDHTVVLSTHILSEVRMTCKRVIIIHEGRIVKIDTVENLEKQNQDIMHFSVELKPSGLDWKNSFEGISGIRIENEEVRNDKVRFMLYTSGNNAYESFFKGVIAKGHMFTEITPVRVSLEEVFLKLTRGEESHSVHQEPTPMQEERTGAA
ncbi:MAG: ATP-binding cassette domain-containing protein [Candidatus Riflebacteria bacterium]|nr:ATP-binding cassette domain-containing protein [Candidatus Riflebacteria bacterium]